MFYVTSSLTRGCVYHLQLMLVLARAVILGSESRGTQDHILLSQICYDRRSAVSLSWCQVPIWGLRPDSLLMWGALSDERTCLPLHLLLVVASAVIFGPNPAGLVTIFYCLRFETPPTWRARSPYLYPPGTGWSGYTPRHWVPLFIASYDSQGYIGVIRTHLHVSAIPLRASLCTG
jgi:hypothetical protein